MTIEATNSPTISYVTVNDLPDVTITEPTESPSIRRLKPRSAGGRSARQVGFIVIEIIAALVLWQVAVVVFNVDSHIVPGPIPVLQSLWAILGAGLLWSAIGVTLTETLVGFVIGAALGIVLAIALSEFKWLDKIANPYIVAFQAMPKIAIAPLFLIWFGFGITSKIVLVVILVFFPVLVNMVAGLKSASQSQVELMMVYRASRWQTLRRLRFYAALPFLFAAFEVTLVLAVTGAVFAEILGSGDTIGLGTLMQIYTSKLAMDATFAVIIVMSLIGILLYAAVKIAGRWALRWQHPHKR